MDTEIKLKERLKKTTLRNIVNSYAPKNKVYEVISNDLLPFTTLKVEPIDKTHDNVKVIFGELGGIDMEFVWEQKNSYKLVEEDTGLNHKTIKKFFERVKEFITTKRNERYDIYMNTFNPDSIIISVNCYAYGNAKITITKTDTDKYSLTVVISNILIDIEKLVSVLAENCMDIFTEVTMHNNSIIVNSELFNQPHTLMLKESGTMNGLMKLKEIK